MTISLLFEWYPFFFHLSFPSSRTFEHALTIIRMRFRSSKLTEYTLKDRIRISTGINSILLYRIQDMSLCKRCGCFASCVRGQDETDHISEEEYLLPGGEWDPNLLRSRSHSKSRRRKGSRQTTAEPSEVRGTGAYIPPHVPGATSIAKFQDFRMLKTVGSGSFGKVDCMYVFIQHYAAPCLHPRGFNIQWGPAVNVHHNSIHVR